MTNPLAAFTASQTESTQRLDGPTFLRQQREDFAAYLARLQDGPQSAPAAAVALNEASSRTSEPASAPQTETAPQRAEPSATSSEADPTAESPANTGEDPIPHIPRFADIPESAQYPLGPYRQAPAEYGGEWWLVNPFTGDEPWTNYPELLGEDPLKTSDAPSSRELPDGFAGIFGPEPQLSDFASRIEFSRARVDWEQQLEHFGGTGIPEGFTPEDVEAATATFEAWGLGEPVFYEGRYGWVARFPSGGVPEFQANPATALLTPHLVVAGYQTRLAQQGATVTERHPFLPPSVFGDSTPIDPEDFQTA